MTELISLKIITNAKTNAIVGRMADGTLKIRLKAKPIEGQANEALLTFISEKLEISRSQIKIVAGVRSRMKKIEISGVHEKINWTKFSD